jgi:hypothetical protein
MQVKLIMNYDIKPGRDQEYFEFLVREFAPGLARLGVQPTESWYTMYGKHPQIMTGGIAENVGAAKAMLASKEWTELHQRLLEFVTNYSHKIIRVTPFFPVV